MPHNLTFETCFLTSALRMCRINNTKGGNGSCASIIDGARQGRQKYCSIFFDLASEICDQLSDLHFDPWDLALCSVTYDVVLFTLIISVALLSSLKLGELPLVRYSQLLIHYIIGYSPLWRQFLPFLLASEVRMELTDRQHNKHAKYQLL